MGGRLPRHEEERCLQQVSLLKTKMFRKRSLSKCRAASAPSETKDSNSALRICRWYIRSAKLDRSDSQLSINRLETARLGRGITVKCARAQEPHDKNLFVLSEAPYTSHRLKVVGWVPGRIDQNHSVRSYQIQSDSSSFGTEEKDIFA